MQQRRRIATSRQASVNPTLAIVLSLALVVSAAFGGNQILKTQEAGGNPIDATTATDSFASGANVVVEDAAISAQSGEPGPRTVKEFARDDQFSMFAVTWEGDRDIAAFIRAENADGSWSPWYSAEPIGLEDGSTANGTDLIYVEPTNKVQVSVAGVDIIGDQTVDVTVPGEGNAEQAEAAAPAVIPEAAAPAPAPESAPESAPQPAPAPAAAQVAATDNNNAPGLAPLPTNYGDIKPVADVAGQDDLSVVFIDGNAEEGGIALATNSTTYGMPNVVSRAGWGANESIRCSSPSYDSFTQAVAVHHTAGSNNYTQAQAAGMMRGMYEYHAKTLGWCDLGYNAVVDKFGTIYEGRAGGLDKSVQGAHVGGYNHNTFGISMIGNYDTAVPSTALINSVGEMIGWKAAVSGFSPMGSKSYTPRAFSGNKYPAGRPMTLPNVFAHRDAQANACPGQYGYAQMGNIRSIAEKKYQEIKGGTASTGSNPIITNPTVPGNPVVTNPNRPAPQTLPAQLSSAINGDTAAISGIVGTLAAIAIGAAVANGSLPGGVNKVGDVEVIQGLKIADLKPFADTAISLSGNSDIETTWNRISTTLGPVLGASRGGISNTGATTGISAIDGLLQGAGGGTGSTDYAVFDNGIILNNQEVGTKAIWGVIADTWAGQGFDLGPLGLPTSEEYASGNTLRVDFQGGYITYDPATGAVDVKLT